jgi:CspA family cold shock protein
MSLNQSPPSAGRVAGTCKFFNERKGWGFIARADGSGDVFVHVTELPEGRTCLFEGDKVTFEIRSGNKGLRAVSLQVC